MDYIKTGNKYWVLLSELDCLLMSKIGYDYFDLFFSKEDWNHISDIPLGGTSLIHFDPSAHKFIKLALEQSVLDLEVYTKLYTYKRQHEEKMLKQDYLFPEEWAIDIFNYD